MNIPRSAAVLIPRPPLKTTCTHYRHNTLWWWQLEGKPYPSCPPDFSIHCFGGGEKEPEMQRNERTLLAREKALERIGTDMMEY